MKIVVEEKIKFYKRRENFLLCNKFFTFILRSCIYVMDKFIKLSDFWYSGILSNVNEAKKSYNQLEIFRVNTPKCKIDIIFICK